MPRDPKTGEITRPERGEIVELPSTVEGYVTQLWIVDDGPNKGGWEDCHDGVLESIEEAKKWIKRFYSFPEWKTRIIKRTITEEVVK